MSANLASETNFYIDFEPITFCQLINKPKMAYSRDALLERDKRETREIWSYGGWPIIV